MLAKVRSLEKITAIELGTGSWPGSDHVDVDLYLKDKNRAREFRQMISDAGLTISALSCHGDPLHPNTARSKAEDEMFRKTVQLAERLEVPVVVTFSGCPGDSEDAKHPNWVTAAVAARISREFSNGSGRRKRFPTGRSQRRSRATTA